MSNNRFKRLNMTGEPINVVSFPPEIEPIIVELYTKVQNPSAKIIVELKAYLKKYPDNPCLLNWLISVYQKLDQYDESVPYIVQNYEKNPTYLFARINYTMHELMKNDNHEIVPHVFNNTFWLPDLYPKREVFHTTEVVSFYHLMALYYLFTDKLDDVQFAIDIMDKTGINPELVSRLEIHLNIKRGFEHTRKYSNRRLRG